MLRMTDAQDRSNEVDENTFILSGTLRVLNSLESEGVVGRYAIGGATALVFYTEPILTEDVDVFCDIPHEGILIDLVPLYKHLEQRGYHAKGEHVIIESVPVQFLVPPNPLVEESLRNAMEIEVEGVKTRVFGYEYLLAIMTQTARPKDRSKIVVALDSAPPDDSKLQDILKRYNLLSKWSAINHERE